VCDTNLLFLLVEPRGIEQLTYAVQLLSLTSYFQTVWSSFFQLQITTVAGPRNQFFQWFSSLKGTTAEPV
jgi:hypothetical protein